MSKRITFFLLLIAFMGGQQAWAQRPVYRRAPTEEKHSRVGFSMRTLIGVDLELKNLGTVAFPRPLNTTQIDENEALGKTTLFFNDGYIAYNPEADETTEFQFAWANATKYGAPSSFDNGAIDADSFTLNRFQTESTGIGALAENTSKYGWEISYEYQWGKSTDRVRYGFLAALGFQNLDFNYSDTVEANLHWELMRVSVANGHLLGNVSWAYRVTGDDSDTGPTFYGGSQNGGTAVILDPENLVIEEGSLGGGTLQDVSVEFDYNGVMAILRLGPTIDLRLIDELHLQLSAGVVGAYLNSRIGISQRFDFSLGLPTTSNTVIAPDEHFEDRSDFLVGFFAEGMLRYQLTPRVGFFSSMMYLNLPEMKDPIIGTVTYDLTLTSPVLASAGILLTF